MKITKDTIYEELLYNLPIKYNEDIILYPITMEHVLKFKVFIQSFTVRKNSRFGDKSIIKMTYLDFLLHSLGNEELEKQCEIKGLSQFYFFAFYVLQLACKDSKLEIDRNNGKILINGQVITPEIFDDLRRIILLQNDVDFDIDEFLHYDTEKIFKKSQDKNNVSESTLEDYIDSLVILMSVTESEIMNMTIRKFWRYMKRFDLRESYTIYKTAEAGGMVKFKEPLKHWMSSIDDKEKYESFKVDEGDLRSKVGG